MVPETAPAEKEATNLLTRLAEHVREDEGDHGHDENHQNTGGGRVHGSGVVVAEAVLGGEVPQLIFPRDPGRARGHGARAGRVVTRGRVAPHHAAQLPHPAPPPRVLAVHLGELTLSLVQGCYSRI